MTVETLMQKLDCTREEALEILKEDARIDKMSMGEVNADLTKDQKQAIKKATATGTRKRTPTKKPRKIDNTKKRFLMGIKNYLEGCGADVTKVKTETELTFDFGDDSYTVKLIKHRPPKT